MPDRVKPDKYKYQTDQTITNARQIEIRQIQIPDRPDKYKCQTN